MDELDTQLLAEITAQTQEAPATEPVAPQQEEVKPEEAKPPEAPAPKMYDEATIKALRAENAKYRIRAREAEARLSSQQYTPQAQQEYEQPYSGQYGNAPQPTYDPRVDDMILDNKMKEIEADPKFSYLFESVNEDGSTFKEELLQEAINQGWPVTNLRALVWDLKGDEIAARVKQKGIDEAYKSMSAKATAAPDRGVSSGKNVEAGEVKNLEDAFRRGFQEQGITDIPQLR
jgi:hypothetical protein